jgi:hypothetical protein
MDKLERKQQGDRPSTFANEGEVNAADRTLLQTPGGEDTDRVPEETSLHDQEAGEAPAMPRSAVTAFHDPGTDDETEDGLREVDEALRRGAEEVPIGRKADRDMPVFDRAGAPARR